MTNQEKKELLNGYIEAKKRFNRISDAMLEVRAYATKITPLLSDMPKGGNGSGNKIERAIERLDSLAGDLEEQAVRMREAMKQVQSAIQTVPDETLQLLLELRYINGYTWEQIAVEMDYSYQWVCTLHGRALNQLNPKQLIVIDNNKC